MSERFESEAEREERLRREREADASDPRDADANGHVTDAERDEDQVGLSGDDDVREDVEPRRADYEPAGTDERTGLWPTLKRTALEFQEDNMTDWAAALTLSLIHI